jgi:hypothetical protein
VSDSFKFNHPLYTDYDATRSDILTWEGIRVPGPPTASGRFPDLFDIVPPGLNTFDYLFPPRPHRASAPSPETIVRTVTPPNSTVQIKFETSPNGPRSPLLILDKQYTLISEYPDDNDNIFILAPRRPSARSLSPPAVGLFPTSNEHTRTNPLSPLDLATTSHLSPRSVTPELQYPDPFKRQTSSLRKKHPQRIPLATTLNPRQTTYGLPRPDPPLLTPRRTLLALPRRLCHHTLCCLCHHHLLHSWRVRRTEPPLMRLLCRLLIHTYLQIASRFLPTSTHISSSLSNMTPISSGALSLRGQIIPF